jgi:hypothetical protein
MVQIEDYLKLGPMRFQFGDLCRVFPIADVPSARLMKIKARSLYFAGIITAEHRVEVDRRADEVIGASKTAGKTLRVPDQAISVSKAARRLDDAGLVPLVHLCVPTTTTSRSR